MHVVHRSSTTLVELSQDREDGLIKAIASRADAYDGPIYSETGKMLWAIQSWYEELENEKSSAAILAAHVPECVLAA
jgi:hypothetical protein